MSFKKDLIRKLNKEMQIREAVHKQTYGALDPFKGFSELELKAMERMHPKEVEESKLARKIQAIKDKQLLKEKKARAELELKVRFPDALNPNSQLSQMIAKEMDEHELHDHPRGALIAAKLASLEIENEGEA